MLFKYFKNQAAFQRHLKYVLYFYICINFQQLYAIIHDRYFTCGDSLKLFIGRVEKGEVAGNHFLIQDVSQIVFYSEKSEIIKPVEIPYLILIKPKANKRKITTQQIAETLLRIQNLEPLTLSLDDFLQIMSLHHLALTELFKSRNFIIFYQVEDLKKSGSNLCSSLYKLLDFMSTLKPIRTPNTSLSERDQYNRMTKIIHNPHFYNQLKYNRRAHKFLRMFEAREKLRNQKIK